MKRAKAIWYALKFGILPWQFYEKKKHYECSYFWHLLMNLGYALRWAVFCESQRDRDFEAEVNNN